MIRLPSYLHKHPDSGVFYFRIAIPQALRPLIRQREWKKSLKTRDPYQAKRTARLLALQADYLFRQIEGNTMPKKPASEMYLTFRLFIKHPDGSVEIENGQLDPDKADEELKLLQALTGDGEQPISGTSATPLTEVIDKYRHEKQLEGSWTPKTEQENRAIFDLLLRIVGDIPMSGLNHEVSRLATTYP